MRLVGSTGANPYACAAAAIAALWGPLHGGANEGVLQTLAEIGSVDRVPEILRRAKDKNDPFRLMGFGQRLQELRSARQGAAPTDAAECLADPLLLLGDLIQSRHSVPL